MDTDLVPDYTVICSEMHGPHNTMSNDALREIMDEIRGIPMQNTRDLGMKTIRVEKQS